MHLISTRNLLVDTAKYPDVSAQIRSWYKTVEASSWQNLLEVREVYATAEAVGNFTVFNIKSYRLIVGINYRTQRVHYKYFLTHAKDDKGKWKNDPYF